MIARSPCRTALRWQGICQPQWVRGSFYLQPVCRDLRSEVMYFRQRTALASEGATLSGGILPSGVPLASVEASLAWSSLPSSSSSGGALKRFVCSSTLLNVASMI